MINLKVEGLRELQAALYALPKELRGAATQRALTGAARPIVKAAKNFAPTDTGTLKRSIYSRRSKQSKPDNQIREIAVRSGKRFRKTGRDAFYWRFIEFGHRVGPRKGGYLSKVGRRSKGNSVDATGFVPAQPFMRPAFESQKFAAIDAFKVDMKRSVEKAAAKVRSRFSGS